LFDKINELADNFFLENDINLEGSKLTNVTWNDNDITEYLYNEEIDKNINLISNHYLIRKHLVDKQRSLSTGNDIVCEGRDIGTVVFPDAQFKFFLNASVESRVNRRFDEFKKKNKSISKKEIEVDLINRDENDRGRLLSPLVMANDAIEIDTTNLSILEQVKKIYNKIKQGE